VKPSANEPDPIVGWWATLGDRALRRRGRLQLWFILLVVAAAGLLPWLLRLDADPLGMPPQHIDSVSLMRDYASGRGQEGLLTFALVADPGSEIPVGEVESFEAALQRQPWIVRTFSQMPEDLSQSAALAREIVPSLLIASDPGRLESALSALEPGRFGHRLDRLIASLEAGSPGAEIELFADPTGLVRPALSELRRELCGGLGAGRALGSEDGRLRLILAQTRIAGGGTREARELMSKVEAFISRWRELRAAEGINGYEVLVTGRPAYVDQIGGALLRDILVTLGGAGTLVLILFWFSFRRPRTLLAVAGVLIGGCAVALAAGALFLGPINLVTAGFCAILVGMGVDFALLLTDRFQRAVDSGSNSFQAAAQALREAAPGISYAALTTGLAFLTLTLARAGALTQLGVLVALGLAATALLMTVFLFPLAGLVRGGDRSPHSRLTFAADRTGILLCGLPKLFVFAVCALLIAPPLSALLSGRNLNLEGNLRSLEPAGMPAARALELIQSATTGVSEPIVVVRHHASVAEARREWTALSQHWRSDLAGELRGFSTPLPVLFDPELAAAGHRAIRKIDWESRRIELLAAWAARGLHPSDFEPVARLLADFGRLATGPAPDSWWDALPESSRWWFLIERHFPGRPGVSVGFILPRETIGNVSARESLEAALAPVDRDPVRITGVSVMQTDLLAWVRGELGLLLAIISVALLLTLSVAYRSVKLVAIHALSLALGLGATTGIIAWLGTPLNLVTAMGLPLMLGVGVDYGIQFLVTRARRGPDAMPGLVRPVALSALTTVLGFASLLLAANPALRGLGLVCATGILCMLASTLLVLLPLSARSRH
jgi:predicted exporter